MTTTPQSHVGADNHRVCVIYTRFSPRPDASTSESCEAQRKLCEDYAFKKGWKVAEVFHDPNRSGKDNYRPQLFRAVSALKKGWILLVYKRDRIARDVYLSELINRSVLKKGAKIEAISGDVEGDGPEQQLIRQVVAAMAEYERKLIARRTSDCLRRYQKDGRLVSSVAPYGYKKDPDDPKRIIPDEREQEVCRMIMELKRAGHTLREIGDLLPQGSARCGHWSAAAIWTIIRRLNRDVT